ncbi:MAG: hypothetical protein H7Y43_17725, partial [Akkermansiaceae bacterium]|nr:hypothetical protein [Verrucomicrobiales bacterium]
EGLAELYQRITPEAVRCRKHMYEKWLTLAPELSPAHRQLIHHRLAAVYHDAALCQLAEGQSQSAVNSLKQALKLKWHWRMQLKCLMVRWLPGLSRKQLTRSVATEGMGGAVSR